MMKASLFLASLCVVLVSEAVGQRPFYAPKPWYDKYYTDENQQGGSNTPSTTAVPPRNPSSSQNGGPLGDRFLTPSDGNRSFKYYNNVPIEGPNDPCIGCTYTLTRNGFIRS